MLKKATSNCHFERSEKSLFRKAGKKRDFSSLRSSK
jgi:hypothetical protein